MTEDDFEPIEQEDDFEPIKKKKPLTENQREDEALTKAAGVYAAEEKTPEELKKMSVKERQQYAQDLNTEREYVRSKGLTKGTLSGASFGFSENIQGLEPQEGELGGGQGEIIGSAWPLHKLFNLFGAPLLRLASKSPILKKQAAAMAHLLTAGLTGATTEALHTVAKGEMPTGDDLLDRGIEWTALDAGLQTLSAIPRFGKALAWGAKKTGKSEYRLLEDAIDATKSRISAAKTDEFAEGVLNFIEEVGEAPAPIELPPNKTAPLERLAIQRFEIEPVSPADLKSRRVSEQAIEPMIEESAALAEPQELKPKNFLREAEALENTVIDEKLEKVAERAVSNEELGNSIKQDVETQLEAAKAEYKPLYDTAEEAAETIMHKPNKTAKEAGDKLVEIDRIKTKPEGYSTVIRSLETALEDAGFTIQRSKAGKGQTGKILRIFRNKEVPVNDLMELGRRLNEIVDYEAVEPTVKNVLKKVSRAVKQDIRDGLANNPDALAAFELAEEAYGRTAAKFGKDSILNIRKSQAGERVANMTKSPSTLGDLKAVVSEGQYKQIEREMLERLNSESFEKSQKSFREMEKHLSAENRKLARDIVDSKNPHNINFRKKQTQEGILNDMSKAITDGTRPDKTLNLWKTPKGQQLIKDTFRDSPNWPQVKTYLEKQSFNDIVATVMKNGKIDVKLLKEFLKNPAARNDLKSLGGQEAVTFFDLLEGEVKKLEKNLSFLESLPKDVDVKKGKELIAKQRAKNLEVPKEKQLAEKTFKNQQAAINESGGARGKKILQRMADKDFPTQAKLKKWKEWFAETLGLTPKAAMSVFGLMKLGIPNTVVTLIGFRMLNKMVTSPRLRKAFQNIVKDSVDPIAFILAVEKLGEAMDEEESAINNPTAEKKR